MPPAGCVPTEEPRSFAMIRDDVEIRPYQPGDEQRILDTFNLVFRQQCGAGFVDRTMDEWAWQFLRNPAGHRIMLALAGDGTVAAQFAGVPMVADTPWGPQRFVHCVDSMTHPAWRQGLPMELFTRTGRRFGAQCLQIGEALCYGYPVELAFRIGQQFLRYESMRGIDYLIRDVATAPPALPPGLHVERVAALPEQVAALWAVVRAEKSCLVRRDARYLQWRYLDHPRASDYELWTVRRGEQLVGSMVWRGRVDLVPGAAAIVDWLVPEGDAAAASALLAVAAQRQQQIGRPRLLFVVPPWSVEWRTCLQHGFAVVPSATWLPRRLVHDVHLPALTPEFLAEAWWYTLGDSDLA